jgi:hypothetical protein
MASKALQIAAVARQIFGTLPNRGVRTGMQFLKKPLTGEYEARYYFDSIEPYARKVSGCIVGMVVSGSSAAATFITQSQLTHSLCLSNKLENYIDHCLPLAHTHRNTNKKSQNHRHNGTAHYSPFTPRNCKKDVR